MPRNAAKITDKALLDAREYAAGYWDHVEQYVWGSHVRARFEDGVGLWQRAAIAKF